MPVRITVLVLLALHALQTVLLPAVTNLRSSAVVMMFAVCAVFADRFTDNPYAAPLLRAIGIFGMLLIMVILQIAE